LSLAVQVAVMETLAVAVVLVAIAQGQHFLLEQVLLSQ
jgi:hypothetical protein